MLQYTFKTWPNHSEFVKAEAAFSFYFKRSFEEIKKLYIYKTICLNINNTYIYNIHVFRYLITVTNRK